MEPKTFECVIDPPCISNSKPGEPFAIPVKMRKWWFIEAQPTPNNFENRLKQFLFNIIDQCETYGLGKGKIHTKQCSQASKDKVEKLFVKAQKREVQYLIIGSGSTCKNFHAEIKSLEQKYEIPTFHIMYDTLTNENFALGHDDLVENIVKKANMKLGGLNYFIKANAADEMLFGSKELIVGININYYDLPLPFLERREFPLGPTIAVIGFAANDLKEPNAFTGDYRFCSKNPKIVLENIQNLLYDVVLRYRSHRGACPRALKIILSVRDCFTRYKIFYGELRRICEFIEEQIYFKGPIQLMTFHKKPDRSIRGEDKPKPGTLLRTFLTKHDGLAFEIVTNWSPVDKGHGEYEARIGHYEIYCSSRRDPLDIPQPQIKEEIVSENEDEAVKPKTGFGAFSAEAKVDKPKTGFGAFASKTEEKLDKPKTGFGAFASKNSDQNDKPKTGFGAFATKNLDQNDNDSTVKLDLNEVNVTNDSSQYQHNNFPPRRPRFREEDCKFLGDADLDEDLEKETDVYYWARMVHTLGHFHQLVTYPTTMPGPVRIAHSLSRRGILILGHNLFYHPEVMKKDENGVLEELSKWTYKNSILRDQRFSA